MPHPNRSKRRDNPGRNPTPEEIRAAREARGWTPAEAAKHCYSTGQFWEDCEAGRKRMHPAMWQFWHLVTDELPTLIPAAREYIAETLPLASDSGRAKARSIGDALDRIEKIFGRT